MSIKHLYLMAVAVTIGCAAGSGTPGTPATPRKGSLLTAYEIATAKADVGTAYDAIARLRSTWLAPRGATSFNTAGTDFPVVFVDGQLYGDLSSLRNIQAYHVAEVRYYNSSEAGAAFGLRGGTSGVIEIKSKVR